MKRLLVAMTALLITAVSAHAKTWANDDYSVGLVKEFEDSAFRYVTTAGVDTLCEITSWPISEPDAVLECDNGMVVLMRVIDEHTIIFNQVKMHEIADSPENESFD